MGLASRKRHQEMLAAKNAKKAASKVDATLLKDSASSVGQLVNAAMTSQPFMTKPAQPFTAPTITEADLLAFQSAHFGDDSTPDNWFVDAEIALNVSLEHYEEDDGLGHYDDGVKRTLTDEQIAIFRHSEVEESRRQQRLQRDEEDYQNRDPDEQAPHSPKSDASSIEDDLVGLARPPPKKEPRPPPKEPSQPPLKEHSQPPTSRRPSQSSRSESSRSTGRSKAASRKREQEIPYDERHKRKWEGFVESEDPEEGSLTHRRIVREMDNLQAESVEMDY